MSKNIKDMEKEIMSKIDQGKIKMKPRVYFIMGSILTFLGLVFAIVTATFLTGLIRFSLRTQGRMAQYKMEQLIENFPWWTLILTIIALIIGIWLIRHYEFSYKVKPWVIIIGFILAIFIAGWLVDKTGFNEIVRQHGPMKGIMRNYVPTDKTQTQSFLN
jgi:uncharacterized membrane protein